MEKETNKIIVISGAGGSGKTTIANALCKDEKFKTAKSTTSRQMRKGEVEGDPYFFVDKQQFEKMIKNNEFLEWIDFNNEYYGTNQKRIFDNLKTNNCVLVLDCVGAKRFKKLYPNDVITVYIYVDLKELEQRLIGRGESEQNIKNRIKIGKKENAQKDFFDLIVENEFGKVEECVKAIKKFVKNNSKIKKQN